MRHGLCVLALAAVSYASPASACTDIFSCYDKKTIQCGGGALNIYVSRANGRAFLSGSYFKERSGANAEIVGRVTQKYDSKLGPYNIVYFGDRQVQSFFSNVAVVYQNPGSPMIVGVRDFGVDAVANGAMLYSGCSVSPGRRL